MQAVGREVIVDWWSYSTQAEVEAVLRAQITAYADDVRTGAFPSSEESYHLNAEQAEAMALYGNLPIGD